MSVRVNDAGSYVVVPEQLGAVWVPQAGQYVQAREVWVPEEVGVGQFKYRNVWVVLPPPPNGVDVDLQQEFVLGGDILANWTNALGTTGMTFDLEWQKNNVTQTLISGAVTGSGLTQTASIPEAELSNGDQVTARMRYVANGVPGPYGDPSDPITYFD